MENSLKEVAVQDLSNNNFFIPHYQRGYRWTKSQVKALLEDIDSFIQQTSEDGLSKTWYCLQPIVVKQLSETELQKHDLEGVWYEVIDGQQRLTTLLLILIYANSQWRGPDKLPTYKIIYATRETSSAFLARLAGSTEISEVTIDKANIDYYHMSKAFLYIHKWVKSYSEKHFKSFNDNGFQGRLREHSKLIWYEVEQDEDSVSLFVRLNMGKIPLTNSELIKALFLSSSSFKTIGGVDIEKRAHDDAIRIKMEISQTWDEIERQLGEPDFWAFITNEKAISYPTRIDLLFNIIAEHSDAVQDPLHTFLHFWNHYKENPDNLDGMWREIEQYFFTLCEWKRDSRYYHKIGYLISIGLPLGTIVKKSLRKKKSVFNKWIENEIRNSLKFENRHGELLAIEDLDYSIPSHHPHIHKILTLFNIETIEDSKSGISNYPFKHHKDRAWSLEHIHAQKSKLMGQTDSKGWVAWINYHHKMIKELSKTDAEAKNKWQGILVKLEKLDQENLTFAIYSELAVEIIDLFSDDKGDYDIWKDRLGNLALLGQEENAALNNSVFQVKKGEIIKMDMQGKYIPICTLRVFLNYYSESVGVKEKYIWGSDDRNKYLEKIQDKIGKYMNNSDG